MESSWISQQLDSEGHVCGACGDPLRAADKIDLLQVVRIRSAQDGTLYPEVMLTQKGVFEHLAYMLHHKCWEEVYDNLHEFCEEPARVSGVACFECETCASHILSGELGLLVQEGRVGLSDKFPSGTHALRFISDKQYVCCSVCLNNISDQFLEGLWDGRFYTTNECEAGTLLRCWREGPCDGHGTPCRHGHIHTRRTG